MGLAVATALTERGDWQVHMLDMNAACGEEAAKSVGHGGNFHKVDVTNYSALGSTFEKIFKVHNRLDFVFANAGVVERYNFYATHQPANPPPEPDQLVTDVCLKSVITTSYLAQHYFRQSPGQGKGACLVMTASCGGLYPSPYSPVYAAAKREVSAH